MDDSLEFTFEAVEQLNFPSVVMKLLILLTREKTVWLRLDKDCFPWVIVSLSYTKIEHVNSDCNPRIN